MKEIISSTMTRAQETAHEEFSDAPLKFDEDLVEGNPDMPHTAIKGLC